MLKSMWLGTDAKADDPPPLFELWLTARHQCEEQKSRIKKGKQESRKHFAEDHQTNQARGTEPPQTLKRCLRLRAAEFTAEFCFSGFINQIS
jgi:hypothetical protein